MDKCQRCNSKKACVSCMQCEKFRMLCERCDGYVHNLPGKKEHKRVGVIGELHGGKGNDNVKESNKGGVKEKEGNVKEECVNSGSMQVNNYVMPSLRNRNANKAEGYSEGDGDQKQEQQYNYYNNDNVNCNLNNSARDNSNMNIMINNNNSPNVNENNNILLNNNINKPFSYSSVYSRDYLAELQVIIIYVTLLYIVNIHTRSNRFPMSRFFSS